MTDNYRTLPDYLRETRAYEVLRNYLEPSLGYLTSYLRQSRVARGFGDLILKSTIGSTPEDLLLFTLGIRKGDYDSRECWTKSMLWVTGGLIISRILPTVVFQALHHELQRFFEGGFSIQNLMYYLTQSGLVGATALSLGDIASRAILHQIYCLGWDLYEHFPAARKFSPIDRRYPPVLLQSLVVETGREMLERLKRR